MMQYMLGVQHDPQEDAKFASMSPEDMQKLFQSVDAFNDDVRKADAWVFGCGLQPIESTTTVRLQDGEPILTDGPFAETKEYLGGFWIIKAPDLDAALDWAKRASVACGGPVEVRPLQDETED